MKRSYNDFPWNIAIENAVGKGENADEKYFTLFTECFLAFRKHFQSSSHIHFVVCKRPQFRQVWIAVESFKSLTILISGA